MSTRIAVITSTRDSIDTVRRYLPSNYSAEQVEGAIVITGSDSAGWTMDGYVLPRLASGLIYGREVTDLVEAVKAHALGQYSEGGWDVIVECWSDAQIAELVADNGASTAREAIESITWLAEEYADRQADARISSGESN